MTYSVSISKAAENDIREAFLWYEEQKENLGLKFEEYFTSAVKSIQDNPLKTQIRYGNTRIYFLDIFPFGIHFSVRDKAILIIAVFHTSQNPKKWKEKRS